MLESQIEINKLEEENQLLINRIKYLEEQLKACNNTNNTTIHNNSLVAVDIIEDTISEDKRKELLDMITPKKITDTISIEDMARGYEEMGELNVALTYEGYSRNER